MKRIYKNNKYNNQRCLIYKKSNKCYIITHQKKILFFWWKTGYDMVVTQKGYRVRRRKINVHYVEYEEKLTTELINENCDFLIKINDSITINDLLW